MLSTRPSLRDELARTLDEDVAWLKQLYASVRRLVIAAGEDPGHGGAYLRLIQRLETDAQELIRLRADHDLNAECTRVALIRSQEIIQELTARVAAGEADTRRLDEAERLAGERQIVIQSDVMPLLSKGREEWGHHRWSVFGQGIGTVGRGSTLRAALDAMPSTGAALAPEQEARNGMR